MWIGGVGLFGFLGQFAVIVFLVFFLLLTGDLYKRKLVKIAGPTLSKRRVTVQILDEINEQIESYLKVQILTSTVVGVATGVTLWWFGVENFAMWGLLAGLFNSIPYLGPVIVTIGLGVVSFMQFDDLLQSAYVCGATFAITSLEGFLLTPALMGRAAQMNPVAIFVGLLFWTLGVGRVGNRARRAPADGDRRRSAITSRISSRSASCSASSSVSGGEWCTVALPFPTSATLFS